MSRVPVPVGDTVVVELRVTGAGGGPPHSPLAAVRWAGSDGLFDARSTGTNPMITITDPAGGVAVATLPATVTAAWARGRYTHEAKVRLVDGTIARLFTGDLDVSPSLIGNDV